MTMVAALFVERDGVYSGLPDVDPWPLERDARTYAGPYPVVAHPPCERWGRFWSGGPNAGFRRELGSDEGCFASALSAVRQWSGVLEHPEASHAWRHYGLKRPPIDGAWVHADWLAGFDGWTCCVAQGAYGHRAIKKTWLYAHGVPFEDLPSLEWGRKPRGKEFARVGGDGFHSAEERARVTSSPDYQPRPRVEPWEHAATPEEFRDVLLSIARSAQPARALKHATAESMR